MIGRPATAADLGRTALPIVATLTFLLGVAAIIWSAGSTLGYDFHAYEGAARRLLDGQPLYDPAVDVAGGFAIYLYPPPFAVAIVPLAILGGGTAIAVWTAGLVIAFLAGVALLPVDRTVRWLVLLLGGLDWPVLYSIKLGQVGPILFLLFAIGWRWLDRPAWLGGSIALGALIKVQPAVLIGWAVLTRRFRATAVTIAVIVAAALVATAVAGLQPWFDYPSLLRRVASPLTTPHNFTPGALVAQAGASLELAGIVQMLTTIGALAAAALTSVVRRADASYLVTIVASQLISPLLWDHYAMLLLLPVAWLLGRGQWWAVLIPLATAFPLVGIVPPTVYPIVFGICLVAPLVLGNGPTRSTSMTLDSAR